MPREEARDPLETEAYGVSRPEPARDRFAPENPREVDENAMLYGNDHAAPALDNELYDASQIVRNANDEKDSFMPKPNARELTPEQLEKRWQEQNRTFTQRTQAIAEERRMLQEQIRQNQQIQQQMLQMMQQPQAPAHDESDPLAFMPKYLRDEIASDPVSERAFRNVGLYTQALLDARLAKTQAGADPQLRQEVETLKAELGRQSLERQYQQAVATYGKEALESRAHEIAAAYQQTGNLMLAINHAAPELVQQHWINEGRKQALQETQKRQQAATASLLEGGRPSPSGSPGAPPFIPGRSAWEDAIALGVAQPTGR